MTITKQITRSIKPVVVVPTKKSLPPLLQQQKYNNLSSLLLLLPFSSSSTISTASSSSSNRALSFLSKSSSSSSVLVFNNNDTNYNSNYNTKTTKYSTSVVTNNKPASASTKSSTNNYDLVFQNATELWSSLRYKVATALTTSLSSTEREELLRRLNVTTTSTSNNNSSNIQQNKNKDDQDDSISDIRQSIAEAVATARVEEAKLQQSKWEKEKIQLINNIEHATTQRLNNEIKLLQQHQNNFSKWQQDVINETTTNTNNNTTTTATNLDTNSTTVLDEVVPSLSTQLSVKESQVHPLLGPVLYDLGYKRIYTTSASILQTLPVWKKQRIYRHNRAKEMATDKLKSLHLGLPGIISLYETISNNDSNNSSSTPSLSIVDGQHRVGMMSILQEKLTANNKNNSFDLDNILVEVYSSSYQLNPNNNTTIEDAVIASVVTKEEQEVIDEKLATDLFLEVNKAEPVKLIDMPGIVKKSDHKIITISAQYLYERYPEMFSSSQKCRSPNVNIDNIRDAIFASNIIQRHSISSSKQLQSWLQQQNTKLQLKYTSTTDSNSTTSTSTVSKSALEKANKYQFYLGLESSWLYE
jgi:hypothetical protein